ncbi:uncharacterized protein BDFB_006741 [Asbolus verrucosus]|uniref:Uncharacterized protein n=1 Tax=Asbolus verrucosus TaxID=1661398 RepID=A0A482VU93_ASBVE|nr:uncharacterized protein BDFB_006741 [Asbolus verrucosus]
MTAKLVLFMTAAFAHHALTAFMKNQYAVEVEQVEACPDNEKTANPLRNLHFSRYNRTHKSLSYDFSYDRPLDEKVGGSMIVERWGDGGWIRMPFVDYQPNICKNVVRYFKDSWVNFYRAAGVPHPDKCPIPAIFQMKNKYSVDVTSVEACPDNDKLVNPITNLKITRYNRTYKTFSYDFTYDRPIDEKIGGSVSVSKWADGRWVDIPFLGFQRDVCKYNHRFFKEHWVTYHKCAGVPHPDRCPIPPGNYSLRNYMVDTSLITFPFFSGRFRVKPIMQDINTKEIIQCYIYIVDVTELF